MAADIRPTIDALWRIESPRLIASLVRLVRDVGLAEDLAQDALVAALEQWPESGVPEKPGAWLMATAKHRALDHFRRKTLLARKHNELGREFAAKEMAVPDMDSALDDDLGDDLLRLIFMSCHPALSIDAQVALTLRLLGGLSTGEIARAFLVPEPAIAQRIVRAKRTLREMRVPFEVPRGAELSVRLSSVLGVIYLIFNEGYSATAGADWMRPALCEDALRLGRVLASLAPGEPEVHGLVALMEIQASRARARVGPAGEPILLFDQNRALWDQLLIRRGLAAIARAGQLGGEPGPYLLQAQIAACHARARTPEQTDWPRIVSLYTVLARVTPSPVVELNRAVAVAMASGPEAGLDLVDALTSEPALRNYHLLPSVRGDLLRKLGRFDEARAEFGRAASLARNARERALLLERARSCRGAPVGPSERSIIYGSSGAEFRRRDTMLGVNPYIAFKGNCREAIDFYKSALDADVLFTQTVGESPMSNMGPAENIMHCTIKVGDSTIMMCDDPRPDAEATGGNISLAIGLNDPQRAKQLFENLAKGGSVVMPLEKTYWAEAFGMLTDKFGVKWMINCDAPK